MQKMNKIFLMMILGLGWMQPGHSEIYDINQFNLKQFEGKVVYLDFWASWCKPCQKSFPWMNSLLKKYPEDQFTVVTINLDENSEDMMDFLQRVTAQFDIYADPSGQFAEKFELEGMPTSYLIGKNGKAVKRHIGFYESKVSEYEKEIEALL